MKNTLRATFTWLHTWVGLLLGWLLYAIFVTGTATYFKGEITQWMRPELRQPSASTARTLDVALRELRRVAPDATAIYIVLPDARDPGLMLNWETPRGREEKTVDAETAKVRARDTRAGEFFYRFHFQLQLPYPWGRWIACFAAAFMLVALVTGIIAHRQFFKDFFTFRPGKGGTRSWLDFHNLTGVIALPFYLMISYTGLIMFSYMFMPWGRLATEPPAPVVAEQGAAAPSRVPDAPDLAAKPLPAAPWGPMLARVEKRWGPNSVRSIYAPGLGTPEGRVNFSPIGDASISIGGNSPMTFNAVTGELLEEEKPPRGFVSKLHDVLYGLHLARFAGPVLRGLFFFMGLLGTAMVATGLVMWTVKRRKRQESLHGPGRYALGHALVEKLNVAVVAGFPIALASLFWANRLLPLGLAQRGDREVHVVYLVWALVALHAFLRPVKRAWIEQLWTGAAAFALLPLLDALTAGVHLREALGHRNDAYVGFLFATFGMGWLLAYAAFKTGRARSKAHGNKAPAEAAP
jgi:uncharacterized iron-regulated membrane protein